MHIDLLVVHLNEDFFEIIKIFAKSGLFLFLVVTRECNKIYLQMPVCAFTDAGAQNNMILLSEFTVLDLEQEFVVSNFPLHY